MNKSKFSAFLTQLASLSQHQRGHVLDMLHPGRDSAVDVIDAMTAEQLVCPHCRGVSIYRHGCVNGLQRYRCCSCKKTFNGLTGTPLARLHYRSRWFDYLDCVIEAKSVRKAAAAVGVHPGTSFRWSHRFKKGVAETDDPSLRGTETGQRQRDARRSASVQALLKASIGVSDGEPKRQSTPR